jgi:hypothetical protein
MTIKQMAAMRVAAFIAVATLVGLAASAAIAYWGLATVGLAASLAVLAYLIKLMYDIELSKLESKNALRKLKDLG